VREKTRQYLEVTMSFSDPDEFEPEYEDLDDEGREPQTKQKAKSLMEKALSPKTPLQEKALRACRGRKFFSTTTQRKLFQKIELKAIGADPNSRIWFAWIEDRINWAAKYHWRIEMLVNAIQNQVKFDKWKSENKELVLAKPTIGQLAAIAEERMKELKNDTDFSE
jgi:hypothetical protein